ncbi:MAG: ATP-binding protein, partial [Acidobacteria bacterium]|nr:ATP-binding protein [Acidobacteriota bacterium]
DAPRFSRIVIRDNGNGFTPRALASLFYNIGGSPKRTRAGIDMGVVSNADKALSPGGRRLIGKIGIGLFSVAQLTREFQIITKTADSRIRTIADVVLFTHSEDDLQEQVLPGEEEPKFRTGTVSIQSVPADDPDSHGTEVILRNLHPQTLEDLGSRARWEMCRGTHSSVIGEDASPPPCPDYHIGRVSSSGSDRMVERPRLPWLKTDSPDARFRKLIAAIDEKLTETESPKLEQTFDNYLQLLWFLALEAPLDYVDKHPF